MLEAVGNRRFFFIVAACLICGSVLASCGGNRPSQSEQRKTSPPSSTLAPTPETAPPKAVTPDTRPVIATFGDSLTAGVAGRSYPEDLQDLLDRNGYGYRVDNQGVSGDTTTDGLARIDNVLAEHPALVIIEFGGNDGLRGIPIEATKKNLEEMIARLKQADIPLVLLGITLPPNYGPDYVKPFTAMFPELAKNYHLKFMPFLLINVYQHPDMMQPDGIHPNGKGNEIVARDVFELIQPFLAERKK
jgi:acyl-CoA thioesterase-1